MRHADADQVAGLVLDRDQAPTELVEHVAGCDECSALADALALTLDLAHDGPPLVAPPDRVRRNVLDALAAEPGAVAEVGRGPVAPVPPAERASGDAVVTPLAERRRRQIPWWAAVAAAAVALVVGLGVGRVLAPQDEPATDDVLMAADLAALDGPQERGMAEAVSTGSDDTLTIRVRASDLEADGLVEVWLINLDGKRMVSLGFLASGDSGDFEVPARLMDEGYRIVDISSEPDDGDPTHSGVSLARGELA